MVDDEVVRKEIVQKGIIEDILSGITSLFNTPAFRGLMGEFIEEKYQKGIDRAELKFNMNFVKDETDLQNLKEYAFESVANVGDDIGKNLRAELRRAIDNKDNLEQIKTRIRDVMKDPKYRTRLKMVVRTEGLRAGNSAMFKAALDTGRPLKKYVKTVDDAFRSKICDQEQADYGKPDQAIPLDEDFVVTVGNKTYRSKFPPFHPNCRTIPLYIEEGEAELDRHAEVEDWSEEMGIMDDWERRAMEVRRVL